MNKLRELRKSKGITMKQLGEYFGLAESTISQYETGKRQPDNELLLEFSKFFNVSTDYLLGNEQKNKPTNNGEHISETALKIAKRLDSISDEGLAKIADYIELVALQEQSKK